jgi:hypothetical protein
MTIIKFGEDFPKSAFRNALNYLLHLRIRLPYRSRDLAYEEDLNDYLKYLPTARSKPFVLNGPDQIAEIEPYFQFRNVKCESLYSQEVNNSFIKLLEFILHSHKILEDALRTGVMPDEDPDEAIAQNLRSLRTRNKFRTWFKKQSEYHNTVVNDTRTLLEEMIKTFYTDFENGSPK